MKKNTMLQRMCSAITITAVLFLVILGAVSLLSLMVQFTGLISITASMIAFPFIGAVAIIYAVLAFKSNGRLKRRKDDKQ